MTASQVKQTTFGIRIILYVASFLVLSVSVSLYFLPTQTDVYFSWTINPPLTAAFLGAGYLTSFLLEFLSAREMIWARARAAVPAVWTFTFLTLIVTLLHIDRFHFGATRLITVAGTWVWLGVYISVPIAMGVLWWQQSGHLGGDPARVMPLPAWVRIILIIQGGVMFLLGIVMFLTPAVVIPLWPWTLSVLTGRAIGAWGVGVGIIALQAAWENDWWRLFPVMVSYFLYGVLQMINLLRFAATLNWGMFSAILYTIFFLSILCVGALGTWSAWSFRQSE